MQAGASKFRQKVLEVIRKMGKKSVNNLYKPMLEHGNVEKKFHTAARGKSNRPDVAAILNPDNIQTHVNVVIEQLSNTAPEGYNVPCPERAWKPTNHGKVRINEGTTKKARDIEKPRYNYEQVVHHIVVSACYEIFMQGMYEFSCGSVPHRGAHYGKKYIEKWIKTDGKNCKYILKMDIRHFFESVDHGVLKEWLAKKIRDKRMLHILNLIIDGAGNPAGDDRKDVKGLPLGFYTSQWLANFMLQPLDHYIKEELRAVHYIRYMDDMVIFGRNKKELHRMQQSIALFLRDRFNLEMKGNWQVFRFEYVERKTGKVKGRPLDFMGLESIMLSCTRKVNRVSKKDVITWYDATAILSYMGYLTHTDTYEMYLQRVKPHVNVKKLKKIVSKHSKREEKKKRERMERSVRNGDGETGGVRHAAVADNGVSETEHKTGDKGRTGRNKSDRMAAGGAGVDA